MGRKALIRLVDGLLLAHGFCDFQPGEGEEVAEVADDFEYEARKWHRVGEDWMPWSPPPPTAEEIEAEADARLSGDRFLRLMFEVTFDQESRLRVLEGRPSITKAQYLQALKSAYAAA